MGGRSETYNFWKPVPPESFIFCVPVYVAAAFVQGKFQSSTISKLESRFVFV